MLAPLLSVSLAVAVLADAPPGSPAFARFVDDYFAARFAAHPTEGTAAGLHEYDDRLDDLSRGRILDRIGELKQQRTRLLSLDRADFSSDDGIDARVLEGQIQAELLDLETLRVWKRNPMGYAGLPGGAIDGLMKRDFAPAAVRLRAVIAREGQIPKLLAAARENLANLHPPREFTDLAIRMAKGSVGFFESSVAAWARQAGGD